MSSVLRKKIRAAGGIAPSILQCAPFWETVKLSIEEWASDTFALDLSATVLSRQVLDSHQALERLGEKISFARPGHAVTMLSGISIDRNGAARYAATRMNQSADSLKAASDLFLKLMSDQPAQALWASVAGALAKPGETESESVLVDPAGLPDCLAADERYLHVALSLATEGGEDGWLLEGGEEPPEVGLLLRLDKVQQYVRDAHALGRHPSGRSGTGRGVLRKSVRETTIRLDAVLDNLPMSIGDCSRLEVGQVVALPGVESGQLSLSAETMNGCVEIARGELGVWKGFRALKLQASVDESFVREIADI